MTAHQEQPALERCVEAVLACAREAVQMTQSLRGLVADVPLEELTHAMQDRDVLLRRLVALRDEARPLVRASERQDEFEHAIQTVMLQLHMSDRLLVQQIQARKQAAYAALVEVQRQQQLTNYMR